LAPVIIHLVAAQSETGKTTIMEKLLSELKQHGLRVAALKGNLQHFELDTPGKDSQRFADAGADLAGFTTPDSFFLFGHSCDQDGTTAAAEALDNFDLLMIEGNKKSKNPKIEVVRSAINPEPLLPENTIAVITDRKDLYLEVPILELGDSKALAEFIVNRFFSQKVQHKQDQNGETLTHFDQSGRPRMVDVSGKEQTTREAYAKGEIIMAPETLNRVIAGTMAKGDVLGVAQVAAVMAVKETGRLIPMAHPLGISGVEVDFQPDQVENKIEVGVRVRLTGQTGVEMEALTGVSVAALTIYDMCKAIDKDMVIQNIRLVEKKGGRSGHYRRGK